MTNEVALEELLRIPIRNGLTKPSKVRGTGVKMIGMGELFAYDRITTAIHMDLVPATEKELGTSSVEEDDLLFARQSLVLEGAGKCSIVVSVKEPTVFESHLIRLRINQEKANPKYLYYYFRSPQGKSNVRSIVEQVAAAGIRGKDLIKLKVPCPNLAVQNKIADTLDCFDRKIESNNRINENLLQQARTLYKAHYIDLLPYGGIMPSDWHSGTVSEIIELHDSKRIPLSSRERADLEKKYPYYGATSIMDYVDRYLFDGIYLLLGEDGTVVDGNGYPILQYVDGKFWVNNHAHVLTGKNGFSVEMLYLLFSLTNIQSIVTGAVQKKISQTNLNSVEVLIPSKDELSSFDQRIQPLFAQIRGLRRENERLEQMRDTLIARVMSTEFDVAVG